MGTWQGRRALGWGGLRAKCLHASHIHLRDRRAGQGRAAGPFLLQGKGALVPGLLWDLGQGATSLGLSVPICQMEV